MLGMHQIDANKHYNVESIDDLIDAVKQEPPGDSVHETIVETFQKFTERKKEIESSKWVAFAGACIPSCNVRLLKKAEKVIYEDYIAWKNEPQSVCQFIEVLSKKPPAFDALEPPLKTAVLGGYKQVCENIVHATKEIVPGKNAGTAACEFASRALQNYDDVYLGSLAYALLELCVWEKVPIQLKEETLTRLLALFKAHPDPDYFKPGGADASYRFPLISWLSSRFYAGIQYNEQHTKSISLIRQLYDLLNSMEKVDNRGGMNLVSICMLHINGFLTRAVQDASGKSFAYIIEFIPTLVNISLTPDDKLDKEFLSVKMMSKTVVERMLSQKPELLTDYVAELCALFFAEPNLSLLHAISSAYQSGNAKEIETINGQKDNFVKFMVFDDRCDQSMVVTLLMLLTSFAKNGQDISACYDKLDSLVADKTTGGQISMVFQATADKQPKSMVGRGNNWLPSLRSQDPNTMSAYSFISVYKTLGTVSEVEAERVIGLMHADALNFSNDKQYVSTMLYYWGTIGQAFTGPLKQRRPWVEGLLKEPALAQSAQHVLDVMDGRTLKKVDDTVQEQKFEINHLGERVAITDTNVQRIDSTVQQQGSQISENKAEIGKTKFIVNELGQRVEVAEDNINYLDTKTVSNAPSWSKQVSQLLNPKSEQDWRLLSQRLGYSPNDIKNWSTQPDPCMSMLAEWYTTHKTSEATNAILRELHEINRIDAATIIEESLKNANDVIDEPQDVFVSPPPVFLSYQWGHQAEVKILKEKLTADGYDCWMDIGQMGGGDSLYQKIDAGIRGAKIILLCMTPQYVSSANCGREVNLTNGLGKNVVPLLLESLDWPPPGSMGPILADKLYIRFFKNTNEQPADKSASKPFWPPESYAQLLERIKAAAGSPAIRPPPEPEKQKQTAAEVPVMAAEPAVPPVVAAEPAVPPAKPDQNPAKSEPPEKPSEQANQRRSAGQRSRRQSYSDTYWKPPTPVLPQKADISFDELDKKIMEPGYGGPSAVAKPPSASKGPRRASKAGMPNMPMGRPSSAIRKERPSQQYLSKSTNRWSGLADPNQPDHLITLPDTVYGPGSGRF